MDQAENYDSGKVKIMQIMSNEETGVTAYNKKIGYAETKNLYADLNIAKIAEFCGCKTTVGQAFLENTLKAPIATHDTSKTIARRQQAIRALVENPKLKKKVETLLTIAQREEQEIIKLLSDFFKGKTCPEIKALEELQKNNPAFYPIVNFFTVNSGVKTVTTALGITSLALLSMQTAKWGTSTYNTFKNPYASKGDVILGGTFTGFVGLYNALCGYMTYKDYADAAAKRQKMHSVNQFIAIAKQFDQLCTNHHLPHQFSPSKIYDTKGQELIEQLQHPRYQKAHSIFFMTPLVHTFLYELYRNEQHLAQLFSCIAEMDVYNAIATKIIESQDTKNKFCFTTFIDNDKPVINAQGFWNVLVGDNAVPNNISENRDIILTGPNAGGKTTSIRALLQNIVLGQTFGVAAADSFEFTQFDVIHSYLNVSDDLINGLSLFKSEVKRAQDILKTTKSLNANQKFFLALDELFTGTVAEDGEKCACEFIKKLITFEQLQFIYATHFHKLKELGRDNKHCMNYKVDAPTKVDGKLVYPFTLSQGANESNVAMDIAEEAGLFA